MISEYAEYHKNTTVLLLCQRLKICSSVCDEHWMFTDGNNETFRPGLPAVVEYRLRSTAYCCWPIENFEYPQLNIIFTEKANVRLTLHCEWIRCIFFLLLFVQTQYKQVTSKISSTFSYDGTFLPFYFHWIQCRVWFFVFHCFGALSMTFQCAFHNLPAIQNALTYK